MHTCKHNEQPLMLILILNNIQTKGMKHASIDAILFDGCEIKDLSFDYTVPGYPAIELIKGGHNVNVTIYNVDEYMKLVLQATLVTGVKQQFAHVKKGFNQVFNLEKLNIFYPKEVCDYCISICLYVTFNIS